MLRAKTEMPVQIAKSDFIDDAEYHRAAFGLVVDELAKALFDHGLTAAVAIPAIAIYDLRYVAADLVKEILGVFEVDETAGHDVRRIDQLAVTPIDIDADQHEAVFRQDFAVADDRPPDITDAAAIDKDVPAWLPFANGDAAPIEFNRVAVADNGDVLRGDAVIGSELGMLMQMAHLAMDGNQVFRLGETEHTAHFFLAGVPGHVHSFDGVVNDIGAALNQPIYGAVNHFLVAGDGMRGQDDGVAITNIELTMAAAGELAQYSRWLALGAGHHKDDFVRRQRLCLADVHQHAVIHIEIAEFPGDFGVFGHGVASDANFALVVASRVNHLLNAGHQRSEGGHHDAPFGAAEHPVERAVDDRFGFRPA